MIHPMYCEELAARFSLTAAYAVQAAVGLLETGQGDAAMRVLLANRALGAYEVFRSQVGLDTYLAQLRGDEGPDPWFIPEARDQLSLIWEDM